MSSTSPEEPESSSHQSLYKTRGRTPASQEERRKKLLEEQKRKRGQTFDAARGLDLLDQPQDETEDAVDNVEEMECTSSVLTKRPKLRKFSNQLMLSEWLLEVPPDLEDKWYFMLCPAGKRCLVLTQNQQTCAYSVGGKRLATFPSLLPGGSRQGVKAEGSGHRYVLLDCVFSFPDSTYYILDVLAWGNQPLLDCQAEFRFFWLKSHLADITGIGEISRQNKFRFVALPYHECASSELESVLSAPAPFPGVMDGVLFYQREAHYTAGLCPLVVWLLPFMLPEVLSVPVNEALAAQQPPDYPGHLEFVQHFQEQNRRERRNEYRARKAASRAVLQAPSVMDCGGEGSELASESDSGAEEELPLG